MRLDSRNLAVRAMLLFMIVTNRIRVKWSSQIVRFLDSVIPT